MKQNHDLKKAFQIRKRSINSKLIQSDRSPKEEFIIQTKKSMGKKYMQQSLLRPKPDQPEKQLREIVMSEEFIRSSKMYKLLKDKMERNDALYMKELNHTNEKKYKLKEEIMQLKSNNYQQKIALWQLKNQFMQLKLQRQQEEEESRHLDQQAQMYYQQVDYEEGQGEELQNQMHEGEGEDREEGEEMDNSPSETASQAESKNCNSLGEEEMEGSREHNRIQFSDILEEIMELRARKNEEEKSKVSTQDESQKDSKTESVLYFNNNLSLKQSKQQNPQNAH